MSVFISEKVKSSTTALRKENCPQYTNKFLLKEVTPPGASLYRVYGEGKGLRMCTNFNKPLRLNAKHAT